MDKCRLSDRNAIHVISSVADALGHDLKNLVINRTSLQRLRTKLREEKAVYIKNAFPNFSMENVVLHWDGKMLSDMLRRKVTERIAVLITNLNAEKFLGAPQLENSTGGSLANALYEVVNDWNLNDNIKAFCCDTTPVNMGHISGAATLLEQSLGRDILFLPCRHHIRELPLRAAFEEKIPGTTGPDVTMFRRFKDSWEALDKKSYKPGFDNPTLQSHLDKKKNDIYKFTVEMLKDKSLRGDYKELLQLTQVFLGYTPQQYEFKYPGAMHHARYVLFYFFYFF